MVVGIAVDTVEGKGVKAVLPFVKKFQMIYPIVLADEAAIDEFKVNVLPTTFFVGRGGKLAKRIQGGAGLEELSAEVKKLVRG